MNYVQIIFAFVILLSSISAAPNKYGWPSSYERFLERQGVWDSNRHEPKSSYKSRKSYERDLQDLFKDWKKQTKWGQKDYRFNRFQPPKSGFSRYGFPGK